MTTPNATYSRSHYLVSATCFSDANADLEQKIDNLFSVAGWEDTIGNVYEYVLDLWMETIIDVKSNDRFSIMAVTKHTHTHTCQVSFFD